MSEGTQQTRGGSPFSRGAVLAVVLVGFLAFFAMLWFIGMGDGSDEPRSGAAHSSANGLNGYSALARMLEAEGYEVEKSRGRQGLETTDLLILTPRTFTDPEEFAQIIENRQYLGPTLVILPKWTTSAPREFDIPEDERDQVKRDWVRLGMPFPADWTQELPEPLGFVHQSETLEEGRTVSVSGLGGSAVLPTPSVAFTDNTSTRDSLVTDASGRSVAFHVVGEVGTDYYESAHWVTFVAEPDLMNNYGLADAQRAAIALAVVQEAGYGDMTSVTFDMTLHGFEGSVNLLTLAFQPPFLAATMCLIIAMFIIAWRAFLRFGPTAAKGQEIAFGKERLVSNGAGLIVRANRFGLLAAPYAALMERRLGRALGIAKPDAESIDHALAVRLPDQEPYSLRAARLHNAEKPMDILRAAQALNDLTGKLAK